MHQLFAPLFPPIQVCNHQLPSIELPYFVIAENIIDGHYTQVKTLFLRAGTRVAIERNKIMPKQETPTHEITRCFRDEEGLSFIAIDLKTRELTRVNI